MDRAGETDTPGARASSAPPVYLAPTERRVIAYGKRIAYS
jgi:hypothetical protein